MVLRPGFILVALSFLKHYTVCTLNSAAMPAYRAVIRQNNGMTSRVLTVFYLFLIYATDTASKRQKK
jgi:hypothetical protein